MSSWMFFCACEETLKVEETAIYLKRDVNAMWQVLFCLTQHDAEGDGEQYRGRTHTCLTPLELRKLLDSDPLCFTDLADLHRAGGG